MNGGSHRLAIAMALPVEVVQERGEAERVERAVRGALDDSARAVLRVLVDTLSPKA